MTIRLRRPSNTALPRLLCAALTLAPFLLVTLVVIRYATDVPYLDQWDFVPLLDRTYLGELTLHDMWVPHNEHRMIFPNIIMVTLARITNWNIYYELAVNIVLALGLFAVRVYQVRATARTLSVPEWHWVIPAISLVVFSVSQYQNWLWGFQCAIFLNVLAVTSGIVLLAHRTFSWTRFAAAAALGVVATYSFASGVVFWPVGLLLILFVTKAAKRRTASIVAWIIIGSLTIGLFFYHYTKPKEHPPLASALTMPLEFAQYLPKYAGGFIAQYPGGDISINGRCALIYGLAAITAAGWACWKLKRMADLMSLLPYLGMSLYCLGNGLLTAIGRVGFRSDQAVSSRYCTIMVPFWTSLVVFLFLLLKCAPKVATAECSRDHTKPARWCLRATIVLLVLGSGLAIDGARRLSARQNNGRTCLLSLARNAGAAFDYRPLSTLYPKLAVVNERYPILKERRLSLFRDE